jgi:gamma-glutamylaminecyclotransferase
MPGGAADLFVYGTLRRGFQLHAYIAGSEFVARCRTVRSYPLLIGGPRFAPMLLPEPGTGYRVLDELYRVDAVTLAALDQLEGLAARGNMRLPVEIVCDEDGLSILALAYFKSRVLADPIHSEYLEAYVFDPRFAPRARTARETNRHARR